MLVQSQLYSSVTRVLHPAWGVYAFVYQDPCHIDPSASACWCGVCSTSVVLLSAIIIILNFFNYPKYITNLWWYFAQLEGSTDPVIMVVGSLRHGTTCPQGYLIPRGYIPRGAPRPTQRLKSGRAQWYDVRLATTSLPLPCPKLFILQNNKNFIIVIPWYHSSWNKYVVDLECIIMFYYYLCQNTKSKDLPCVAYL